jgi:hypothetical protein
MRPVRRGEPEHEWLCPRKFVAFGNELLQLMKTFRPIGLWLGALLTLSVSSNAAPAAEPAATAVAPATDTQPLMLDLDRFYNERFITPTKTNDNWKSVAGRQVFDGLPFQVDGRGCVYGSKVAGEHKDFIGIQVGRKFDELHLLHVTQWADVEGQQIALIRFNYADGSKHEFPILFGGQVRDSHRMPSEEKELLTDPNTKVVWRGPGAARFKSTLRLFKSLLVNPFPEKTVNTLDVVSTGHMASYDLIAATVANRDPARPVTPPCAADGPERHFDGVCTVRVTARGTGEPVAEAVVDVSMEVDKANVVAIPVRTSAAGVGLVRYPVGRATRLWFTVAKADWASQDANLQLVEGSTNSLEIELHPVSKIRGMVHDAAGKPLAGVQLVVWPDFRTQAKGGKTQADGSYQITWNPQSYGGQGAAFYLIAQEQKANLTAIQEVDEGTTNLDLSLEPGLVITGRATDSDGKVLTNAEAQVMFWGEHMGASLGKTTRVDAEGRFEVKALPPARRYGVSVSAKGYGRKSHTLEAADTESRRVELEPSRLPVANLRVAGVVTDADDKPVAKATVNGYGDDQPAVNGQTDAKGRFSFDHVCAGPIRLMAFTPGGGSGNTMAEGGDTNVTIQLGSFRNLAASAGTSHITGTLTDPEGKPASRIAVTVFPFGGAGQPTDAQGHFKVSFDPQEWQRDATRVLIARDPARNLAVALDLEEGATNAELRLEPGWTLAGSVTDFGGKAISDAQVHVIFQSDRFGSSLGEPQRVEANGHFEIKGLPAERRYTVNASAKGFGQDNRQATATGAENRRLELDPLQLAPADQRLAGVVVDDDDKPVARASLYTYGEKQPNLNGQTDAKGRFAFDKVCAGAIQISANNSRGGYANVTTEGGDTNVTIHLSASPGMRPMAPRIAGLKGKPLPDLAPLGLAPTDCPADQPLLAVLVDAEQRPSRRALRVLAEQAAALKDKGVAVIVLQAGAMSDEAFAAWKRDAALPFPVACFKTKPEQARAAWGAAALPWLVLTDKAHRVTAEGFAPDEVAAQLQALKQ